MKKSRVYLTLALGPALIWGIGFLMNAVVMALNGGSMPVQIHNCTPDIFIDAEGPNAIHSCMVATSHLKFLADWIYIRGYEVVASPGDGLELFAELVWKPFLFMLLGLFIFRNDEFN